MIHVNDTPVCRFANEKVAKLEKENGYLKGANEEMR